MAVFSVDLFKVLVGKVASLEQGSLQAVQLSEEILEAVLPVVASAKFIRASLSARILITLEDALELMTENKADVAKAKLAAKDCLDLAWAVREGLQASGSEVDSWSNESIKDQFATVIAAVESLKNGAHEQAA